MPFAYEIPYFLFTFLSSCFSRSLPIFGDCYSSLLIRSFPSTRTHTPSFSKSFLTPQRNGVCRESVRNCCGLPSFCSSYFTARCCYFDCLKRGLYDSKNTHTEKSLLSAVCVRDKPRTYRQDLDCAIGCVNYRDIFLRARRLRSVKVKSLSHTHSSSFISWCVFPRAGRRGYTGVDAVSRTVGGASRFRHTQIGTLSLSVMHADTHTRRHFSPDSKQAAIVSSCRNLSSSADQTLQPLEMMKMESQTNSSVSTEESSNEKLEDKVFLRDNPKEGKINLFVQYRGNNFNFDRFRDEKLDDFIARMKNKLSKKGEKVKESKAKEESEGKNASIKNMEISIALIKNGSTIALDSSLSDVVAHATHLCVDGKFILIEKNVPVIPDILVETRLFIGLPIILTLSDKFDRSVLSCEWYRQVDRKPMLLSSGEMPYIPKLEDKDKHLEFHVFSKCHPSLRKSIILGTPADGIKEGWRVSRRKEFLKNTQYQKERNLRVATFNILAPMYCRTDKGVDPYFPYCNTEFLEIHYRKPLLAEEISSVDADIFCMQEVSMKIYDSFLVPLFGSSYSSSLALKVNTRLEEGCACFVKSSKFQVVEDIRESFQYAMLLEKSPFKEILQKVHLKWPNFKNYILPKMTTIFQYLVLKRKEETLKEGESPYVIVGNSHFYFHPQATHIRALQAAAFVYFANELKKKYGKQTTLILTGDLNSMPHSMSWKLLFEKGVDSTDKDWHYGRNFQWEKSSMQRTVPPLPPGVSPGDGVNLQLPEGFDVYNAYEKMPLEFTHHIKQFWGVLDYIIISRNLEVLQCLPGIEYENLEAEGLPSEFYPSDHILLCADLSFI